MLDTKKKTGNIGEGRLAPYAVASSDTRGRVHPEAPHAYRTAFQRDRDRILHSRCFRRLEYKTQVFVNGTADHYRTRLTHTFEMTAVGRTLARALGANEDLTECIALAHDIGHSPFGHCGEEALDELMKDHGGFDHNLQSARWVEDLEHQYPEFCGLNLTWEVRAGLRKHQAHLPGETVDGLPIGPFQQMEAQIADIADDITYHAHDVDDGLDAGLLDDGLLQGLELWRRAHDLTQLRFPGVADEAALKVTVRNLLDIQVADILATSSALIERHAPRSPEEVMNAPERLVDFSPAMRRMQKATRAFLFTNMYFHPAVSQANRESARMMSRLFQFYVENPTTMGRKARARIPSDGLWRAACDYVSGMTDRYALEQYAEFGLNQP
jgi:dGTPase